MKLHLKPYWIFITVSIPQALIFWIFLKVYSIINSRLDENSIRAWGIFAICLGLLGIGFTVYGIFTLVRRKPISPYFGISLLIGYIPWLYMYLFKSTQLIPWSIPRWMLFGVEPQIYVVTLIMPSLAFAVLLSVFWLTPLDKKYTVWKELIITVCIPLFWYLAINVFAPLLRNSLEKISPHIIMVLIIACSVCFMFMICRLIFLLLSKKPKIWMIVRIPVIIIFPTLGLMVNNGVSGFENFHNTLGDFSSIYFYILAVLTGILLLIPTFENKQLRLLLFFLKAVVLMYVLYFFIVLLPFLPISIFAVIVLGLGFLMLTPLVLMFIHVKSLWADYEYLTNHFKKYILLLTFAIGIFILPITITASYSTDRVALSGSLEYVYQSDYKNNLQAQPNLNRIKYVLENIKAGKGDGRIERFMSASRMPYLTSYYNWLVLDNLTLSNKKVEKLERVFFGQSDIKTSDSRSNQAMNEGVKVNGLKVETVYDEKEGFFKSWIHFELKNQTKAQKEYFTTIDLPAGCWISNYYLYVNNEKKYGIITDKRAATWTYQQILQERRDPGILYYLSGNRVIFRVFPFASEELRKTGFEVIHKEPVSFMVDENKIDLNSDKNYKTIDKAVSELDGRVVYVPGNVKKELPKIDRQPYYNFIIDFSKENEEKIKGYINRVNRYISDNGLDLSNVKVVAANYKAYDIDTAEFLRNESGKVPVEGGFFLERHIKSILTENYKSKSTSYPAIVVVTDNIMNAILPEDFYDFKIAMPDSDKYYSLGSDGSMTGFSMLDGTSSKVGEKTSKIPSKGVLAWPDEKNPEAYLADDSNGSIVIKGADMNKVNLELKGSTWNNGLILQGMSTSLTLEPSGYYQKSLEIITNSFRTKIMTPLTSFIVVEDEAQEKAMLEKQKQLLSSKRTLDAGEETQMSEPPLWVLVLMVVILWVVIRVRFLKRQSVLK